VEIRVSPRSLLGHQCFLLPPVHRSARVGQPVNKFVKLDTALPPPRRARHAVVMTPHSRDVRIVANGRRYTGPFSVHMLVDGQGGAPEAEVLDAHGDVVETVRVLDDERGEHFDTLLVALAVRAHTRADLLSHSAIQGAQALAAVRGEPTAVAPARRPRFSLAAMPERRRLVIAAMAVFAVILPRIAAHRHHQEYLLRDEARTRVHAVQRAMGRGAPAPVAGTVFEASNLRGAQGEWRATPNGTELRITARNGLHCDVLAVPVGGLQGRGPVSDQPHCSRG
jgi:hypothetical protein